MEKHPELIHASYGKISQLVLVYPGVFTKGGEAEYQPLIKAFDPNTIIFESILEVPEVNLKLTSIEKAPIQQFDRIKLKRSKREEYSLSKMLYNWKKEIDQIYAQGYISYQRWAQDPFVVLKWNGSTILLKSSFYQRVCDFFMPSSIARQAGKLFFTRPSDLYLEGGNILRGKSGVFIGKDLIRENRIKLNLDSSEVMALFKENLGVNRIIPVGLKKRISSLDNPIKKTSQPLFHIDLFLTIGGMDEQSEKEQLFIACPSLTQEILANSTSRVREMKMEDERLAGFKEVKDHLTEIGFSIIKIPIYVHNGVCYSWNNCLVEIYEVNRVVYLPNYLAGDDYEGLNDTFTALQDQVESIYSDLGFKVIWISTGRLFRILAKLGGSLHCIAKVLHRENQPSSTKSE